MLPLGRLQTEQIASLYYNRGKNLQFHLQGEQTRKYYRCPALFYFATILRNRIKN